MIAKYARVRRIVVGLVALAVGALAFGRDAVVVKMSGDVSIQLPGQTAFQPYTDTRQPIPEGASLRTGATGEVFLEVMVGVVATLKPNTTVRVEQNAERTEGGVAVKDATLDVSAGGGLVSTLNPKMKDINRYKVRTPLGVAAARGTVFSVRVVPGTNATTVGTMSGTIVMTVSAPGGGTRDVTVPFGNAISTAAGQALLAQAAAQNPNLAQDIVDAVRVVADNVRSSTTAVDSPDAATSTLAAVVSAAVGAVPGQATTIVGTAVGAAVSSSSATGRSTADTNAAAAAITEAAVRSAPGQAQNIASQAAQTVVEVRVTEAVAQARATGGDANAAAAQASSDSRSTLQSVAQGAVSGTGNTSLANQISSAVNTGASAGLTSASNSTNTTPPTPPTVTTPPEVITTAPVVTTPPVQLDARPTSPTGGTP